MKPSSFLLQKSVHLCDIIYSTNLNFLDTEFTLINFTKYSISTAKHTASMIYAKRNGEIIQIHYNEIDALKEVFSDLINRFPSAMAKNIDCGCCDVIQLLEQLGFVEITKQYEMVRDI